MSWTKGMLETEHLRIQITNRHINNPGRWVCHVRELSWACKPIGIPNEATEQDAQDAVVIMVRDRLREMLASLK